MKKIMSLFIICATLLAQMSFIARAEDGEREIPLSEAADISLNEPTEAEENTENIGVSAEVAQVKAIAPTADAPAFINGPERGKSVPNSTNKKVTFDFDAYNWSDPSSLETPLPYFLTDEQFFGKWDNAANKFVIEGKLDYDYISTENFNLTKVFEAVQNGDYDKAKEELLTYYQSNIRRRGLGAPSSSKNQKFVAQLAMQCFHVNGNSGQRLVDIFSVPSGENSWMEADVKENAEAFIGRKMPLYLHAINKDDYRAEFYTKESELGSAYTPYLEVIAGTTTIKILPIADTYVRAGKDYSWKNFGSEPRMYAEEHVGGWAEPVTEDTKKAYLMFDLSAIPEGSLIHSAKLKLYGKWVDTAEAPRNNPGYKKNIVIISSETNTWNENDVNFTNVQQTAVSYDGQYGFDWLRPLPQYTQSGGKVDPWHTRIDQEMLRYSSWWDQICNEYRATGDEDYARTAMLYLHNFITETFYAYMGIKGGFYENYYIKDYSKGGTESASKVIFVPNWTPVEKGGLGAPAGYRETLDASLRMSAISNNIPKLYLSEYMTPELLTTFLKYMWHLGDYGYKNWSSSEAGGNWGTYQSNGTFALMAQFPEFSDIRNAVGFQSKTGFYGNKWRAGNWMDIWWENLIPLTTEKAVYSDGASNEHTLSYTDTIFSSFVNQKGTADTYGLDYTLPDNVSNAVITLAHYIVNTSRPGLYEIQYGDGNAYTRNFQGRMKQLADWLKDPLLLWAAYDGKAHGAKAPDYTSYAYLTEGKIIAMRSGWDNDARFLHINADGGKGVHAHWDDLGIIVSAYGEYLLADCLDNVRTDHPVRRWLVSSKGHNTIEINDFSQTGRNPTGTVSVLPNSGGANSEGVIERSELNDRYDFGKIWARDAYKNIKWNGTPLASEPWLPQGTEPGADVRRNVLFIKPNFWIVSDHIDPVDKNKVNKYTQMWHTKESGDFTIDGQYVLKAGEQRGDTAYAAPEERIRRLSTQIENTQYVPDTGTGAFVTTNKGANIMVVPANINEVTPKLLYGKYHNDIDLPYGVFEQNVKGATKMDTVLFPTKAGEKYKVETTPITLEADLPQGSVSAFSAEVKDLSGKTNEEYKFNYHIVHVAAQKADRLIGKYKTDGTLSYLETKMSGLPRRIILEDATHFADEERGFEIFKSNTAVSEISIDWQGDEINISSSKITSAAQLGQLTIYAPRAVAKVNLNGKSIDFKQSKNYVYFGNAPMLDGSYIVGYEPTGGEPSPGTNPPIEPPVITPNNPSHGNPGATGGGKVSGGTGGVSVNPLPEANLPKPSDKFQKELYNHWGSAEISHLVDAGIIEGEGSALNLSSNVTKAEFVTMILRALKINATPYQSAFSDVKGDEWFAGYIQSAYDKGIVEGFGQKVSPLDTLSREQAAKIVLKALAFLEEFEYTEELTGYSDIEDISDWAKAFMATAVSLSLMKGDNGKLTPTAAVPREQAMMLIYRMLERTSISIRE